MPLSGAPTVRFAQSLLAATCLAIACPPALAIEVERAEAKFADQRYSFELVATLDAPIDRVDAVLKDYDGYSMLDERILESRVLEHVSPTEVLLFTSLRACFGPFCRNVKRVERVIEDGHELRASTMPDRSDVKYGETFTQISNAGERTRVVYRTVVSPDFWIPRFVGRRVMLKTLREASLNLFDHVEKRASQALQSSPGQPEVDESEADESEAREPEADASAP